jgi:hypothetical protein
MRRSERVQLYSQSQKRAEVEKEIRKLQFTTDFLNANYNRYVFLKDWLHGGGGGDIGLQICSF